MDTCLRCDVMSVIKLRRLIAESEYFAKLQARRWLSGALSSSFSSVVARRTMCTRQRRGSAPQTHDLQQHHRHQRKPTSQHMICGRAFQFAIRIDSIRYANRLESICLVKKSAFRFTIVVMQFFLVYLLYSLSQKIS